MCPGAKRNNKCRKKMKCAVEPGLKVVPVSWPARRRREKVEGKAKIQLGSASTGKRGWLYGSSEFCCQDSAGRFPRAQL